MSGTSAALRSSSQRFSLARTLGSGPDGVAYAATDLTTSQPVVVHRLATTSERLAALSDRARRLALTRGSGFLTLFEQSLDASEPTLIIERPQFSIAQKMKSSLPVRAEALRVIRLLARTLVEAHRVGLAHGGLAPSTVWLRDDGNPALDFLRPDTGLHTVSSLDAACRAPEVSQGPEADLFALGAIASITLALTGPTGDETLTAIDRKQRDTLLALVKDLTQPEPSWRPTAVETLARLDGLLGDDRSDDAPTQTEVREPTQLGRFRVEHLLGRGAMGRVYRGVDLSTGRAVALKVLDGLSQAPVMALRRFRKEARLLSEVQHPFIANLLEANVDAGMHFIAVELVEGRDLSAELKDTGPLTEHDAIEVVADVARAMVEVHARGIVHRDIKPSNLIRVAGSSDGTRVKLIDFGVARHVDENVSLQLTEQGEAVGTPQFMSPEQVRGDALDGRSDVYALGTTLFTLIAGKPPFSGDSHAAIFTQQLFEAPPRLDTVKAGASHPVTELIAKCLEKERERRPTMAQLLQALEGLLDRPTLDFAQHPTRPTASQPVQYRFEWQLHSTPAQLWASVSNTDRLNRAIGQGPVEESFHTAEGELQRIGRSSQIGMGLAWQEHPYEWVENQRLGVLREYSEGPLHWLRSTVTLTPNGTGTKLQHTIELMPRGVLGRAAAAVEVGLRTRLALARVYRRIDELLAQRSDQATVVPADAFEKPFRLEPMQEARLTELERAMIAAGADAIGTARLGDYLRQAPEQSVARIRPLALARTLKLEAQTMIATCLYAAREGALVLGWDLICPTCRIPSQMKDTLKALKEHGHCAVCSIDYSLDLASSVELVFSAHAQVRPSDKRTYCLGSPGHSPHVVAQVRVGRSERVELDLALEEGRYRLAGRQLSFGLDFTVRPDAGNSRFELALSKGPGVELRRSLTTGSQQVVLDNDTGHEQLVRIERASGRDDALTAAKVASQPLFRKLFPLEVLAPGQMVSVSNVALLLVEVASTEDERAADTGSFGGRYALFRRLEQRAAAEGGAVVKIAGDGVVAVFNDVVSATRVALELGKDPLPLRAAVHRGPAAAVTIDEHLDYFGNALREASRLLQRAKARELVLSETAASDPGVVALTATLGNRREVDTSLGTPCEHVALATK